MFCMFYLGISFGPSFAGRSSGPRVGGGVGVEKAEEQVNHWHECNTVNNNYL